MISGLDVLLGFSKLVLELNRFVILRFPLYIGLILLCIIMLILLLFLLIWTLEELQVLQGVLKARLLGCRSISVPYLLMISSASLHFVSHTHTFIYSTERRSRHLRCLELRFPGDLTLRDVACLYMVVWVRFWVGQYGKSVVAVFFGVIECFLLIICSIWIIFIQESCLAKVFRCKVEFVRLGNYLLGLALGTILEELALDCAGIHLGRFQLFCILYDRRLVAEIALHFLARSWVESFHWQEVVALICCLRDVVYVQICLFPGLGASVGCVLVQGVWLRLESIVLSVESREVLVLLIELSLRDVPA